MVSAIVLLGLFVDFLLKAIPDYYRFRETTLELRRVTAEWHARRLRQTVVREDNENWQEHDEDEERKDEDPGMYSKHWTTRDSLLTQANEDIAAGERKIGPRHGTFELQTNPLLVWHCRTSMRRNYCDDLLVSISVRLRLTLSRISSYPLT